MGKGAVKSLFFGGHCVHVARLSLVVENCRYSVFFGTRMDRYVVCFAFSKVKSLCP